MKGGRGGGADVRGWGRHVGRVRAARSGEQFVLPVRPVPGLSADPARVEVSVDDHRITGTVLTLAGSPGWGVWYARSPLSLTEVKTSLTGGGPTVTVYDAAGKVVARGGVDE